MNDEAHQRWRRTGDEKEDGHPGGDALKETYTEEHILLVASMFKIIMYTEMHHNNVRDNIAFHIMARLSSTKLQSNAQRGVALSDAA